jgi:hypothetical protein
VSNRDDEQQIDYDVVVVKDWEDDDMEWEDYDMDSRSSMIVA